MARFMMYFVQASWLPSGRWRFTLKTERPDTNLRQYLTKEEAHLAARLHVVGIMSRQPDFYLNMY